MFPYFAFCATARPIVKASSGLFTWHVGDECHCHCGSCI